MATGTVKWFNEQKGYGFIQPDEGGRDVFVHISAVERSGLRGLAEGQKVSYDVEADRRTGKEMLWGERRGAGIIVARQNRRSAPCPSSTTRADPTRSSSRTAP